ncbi:MAG: exodeoxyribonuclease VII small subunit [Silvanigrellaceae bacterium]|nr:exodeoxyribonuclease VII small subunit [Silvanigrellaceae bacterium]
MSLEYNEIYNKVNQIIASLERDNVSIDDLSVELEKAFHLIDLMKNKLNDTEVKINEIINTRSAAQSLDQKTLA